MRSKNTTFYAGLVILLGFCISCSSSAHAQGNKILDSSNYGMQDYIRSSGFISSRPIPHLGTIAGSAAPQVNLSQGDLIYIKLEPETRVKAGDRFFLAHWGREIIHPQTQEKMGHLVRISGVAVILDGSGRVVPARITESFYQVRYGDLIIFPLAGPPPVLTIRPTKKIQGMIVASPEEEENITERLAVYIDRGTQDGVMVGDLFGIYQMPYYTEEVRESNANLPLLEVGEGVVVFANAENSTMLITKSSQAIYIGDRIVSVKKR
jgi:hypothetical protein